jgi:hypothetical protein
VLRPDVALVASVHEAWLQEVKHAVGDADIDAVDARGRLRSGGQSKRHGS